MLDLSKILEFIRLLNKFRQVKRVIRIPGEDSWENDAEHSYNLAMLAWYIIDSHSLALDRDKVLKYALIHDFVEVYAGDTYIYSNQGELDSKKERESEAENKLRDEFPEYGDLYDLIEQYEKRSDKECRFVYALDKIQPILNIYIDGGRTWKEMGVTLQMIIEHKKNKVKLSPEINLCFKEIVTLLEKEEKQLFGRE